ncbi:hypothetical protein FOL47_004158, partial [Perkinsus chesapeaki]
KALGKSVTHTIKEAKPKVEVRKFVDDSFVDTDDLAEVEKALDANDLTTKPAQPLLGGTVLGIHVCENGQWVRKSPVEILLKTVPETRQQLASLLGKLTGHYPCARWLRVTCAMITRLLATIERVTSTQYDFPLPESVKSIVADLHNYIHEHGDPCSGQWYINPDAEWVLYTDASRHALAGVLTIGGTICEDRAWLRPRECRRHINVAEIEAVVRSLDI